MTDWMNLVREEVETAKPETPQTPDKQDTPLPDWTSHLYDGLDEGRGAGYKPDETLLDDPRAAGALAGAGIATMAGGVGALGGAALGARIGGMIGGEKDLEELQRIYREDELTDRERRRLSAEIRRRGEPTSFLSDVQEGVLTSLELGGDFVVGGGVAKAIGTAGKVATGAAKLGGIAATEAGTYGLSPGASLVGQGAIEKSLRQATISVDEDGSIRINAPDIEDKLAAALTDFVIELGSEAIGGPISDAFPGMSSAVRRFAARVGIPFGPGMGEALSKIGQQDLLTEFLEERIGGVARGLVGASGVLEDDFGTFMEEAVPGGRDLLVELATLSTVQGFGYVAGKPRLGKDGQPEQTPSVAREEGDVPIEEQFPATAGEASGVGPVAGSERSTSAGDGSQPGGDEAGPTLNVSGERSPQALPTRETQATLDRWGESAGTDTPTLTAPTTDFEEALLRAAQEEFGITTRYVTGEATRTLPAATTRAGEILLASGEADVAPLFWHELVHAVRMLEGSDLTFSQIRERIPAKVLEQARLKYRESRGAETFDALTEDSQAEEGVAQAVEDVAAFLELLSSPEGQDAAQVLARDKGLLRRFVEAMRRIWTRMTGGGDPFAASMELLELATGTRDVNTLEMARDVHALFVQAGTAIRSLAESTEQVEDQAVPVAAVERAAKPEARSDSGDRPDRRSAGPKIRPLSSLSEKELALEASRPGTEFKGETGLHRTSEGVYEIVEGEGEIAKKRAGEAKALLGATGGRIENEKTLDKIARAKLLPGRQEDAIRKEIRHARRKPNQKQEVRTDDDGFRRAAWDLMRYGGIDLRASVGENGKLSPEAQAMRQQFADSGYPPWLRGPDSKAQGGVSIEEAQRILIDEGWVLEDEEGGGRAGFDAMLDLLAEEQSFAHPDNVRALEEAENARSEQEGFDGPSVTGFDPLRLIGRPDPESDSDEWTPFAARTDSAAFKRWFGDSKVVDENGDPLVVYHGTGAAWPFTEFHEYDGDREALHFFAASADIADVWAGPTRSNPDATSARIIPAYIRIKNPLTVQGISGPEMAQRLRDSEEHDGLVLLGGNDEIFVVIARDPTQIKSATGNRGTFDPDNPDIRFAARRVPQFEGDDLYIESFLVGKHEFEVAYSATSPRAVDVTFRRIDSDRPRGIHALTKDEPRPHVVMATVAESVREYVSNEQRAFILTFSAEKDESSRIKLYDLFAKRFESAGFVVVRNQSDSFGVEYEIEIPEPSERPDALKGESLSEAVQRAADIGDDEPILAAARGRKPRLTSYRQRLVEGEIPLHQQARLVKDVAAELERKERRARKRRKLRQEKRQASTPPESTPENTLEDRGRVALDAAVESNAIWDEMLREENASLKARLEQQENTETPDPTREAAESNVRRQELTETGIMEEQVHEVQQADGEGRDLNDPHTLSTDAAGALRAVDDIRGEVPVQAQEAVLDAAVDRLKSENDLDASYERLEQTLATGGLLNEFETAEAGLVLEALWRRAESSAGEPAGDADLRKFRVLAMAYRVSRTVMARALGQPAFLGGFQRFLDAVSQPTRPQSRDLARLEREIARLEQALGVRRATPRTVTPDADVPFAAAQGTRRDITELEEVTKLQKRPQTADQQRLARLKARRAALMDSIDKTIKKRQKRLRKASLLSPTVEQLQQITVQHRLSQILSDFGDRLTTARTLGLITGPRTHLRNIVGNTANIAIEGPIKKFSEAIVNTGGLIDPNGATYGEAVIYTGNLLRSLMGAAKVAVRSFTSGRDLFVEELGGKGVQAAQLVDSQQSRLDYDVTVKPVVLPGRFGRALGIATSVLSSHGLIAMDGFFKHMAYTAELHAAAYRLATRAGLRGRARQAEMQRMLADFTHPIHNDAFLHSQVVTFQDEGGAGVQKADDIAKMLRRQLDEVSERASGGIVKIGSLTFPFIKTPIRIAAAGVKLTPLFALPVLFRSTIGRKSVAGYAGEGGRANAARDAATALTATAVTLMILEMLGGDGEDEFPMLTGSEPLDWKHKSLGYRTAPALSVRTPWGWIRYGEVEPIATSIGMAVDFVNDAQAGGLTSAMSGQGSAAMAQMTNKTFLAGLSDIQELISGYGTFDKRISKYAVRNASSFVPNFVRQIARESESERLERPRFNDLETPFWTYARSLEYDVLPIRQQGIVTKYDLWGRPVDRPFGNQTGAMFLRLLSPILPSKADIDAEDADIALWAWNDLVRREEVDGKPYHPSPPSRYNTRGGVKMLWTAEEYEFLVREAGTNALRALIGKINDPWNPTEKDIEIIRKTLSKERSKVVDKIRMRRK